LPGGAGNLSFLYRLQTRSGAMCTGGSILRVKAAGVWRWLLTPCSVEVKNVWSYTSTPSIRLHEVMLT